MLALNFGFIGSKRENVIHSVLKAILWWQTTLTCYLLCNALLVFQDLRAHVLKNLLDTEMSYVQNLQFLVSVGLWLH